MTSCDDELLDIFLQNESSLKRYLQTVSRSRQDAEDLTQEAWIKLARNGSAGLSNPRGYLLRIARSVGIDYNRTSRSRLKHHEIDVCLSVPDDRADPYRCTEDRDQLRQLMEIIEDLPVRQRRLLIAARLEQRGHAALAKEFDVSLRTVELEIRRALDYCTARLAKKTASDYGFSILYRYKYRGVTCSFCALRSIVRGACWARTIKRWKRRLWAGSYALHPDRQPPVTGMRYCGGEHAVKPMKRPSVKPHACGRTSDRRWHPTPNLRLLFSVGARF